MTERLRREGHDALFLQGGLKAWIDNGQSVQDVGPINETYVVQASDIDLLRKAGLSENDIAHSVKVAEKALEIAGRTNRKLDMELVGRGCSCFMIWVKPRHMRSNMGNWELKWGWRWVCPTITAVMEKHIRGGLSTEEAVELGLPVKDYTLGSPEERIIIYADRLVDIITDGIVALSGEKEAEERFEEILRNFPKYGKNDTTLERYLNYHREIQGMLDP